MLERDRLYSKADGAMQNLGGERNWDRWNQLKAGLDEAYKAEEDFWRIKSRVQWLK